MGRERVRPSPGPNSYVDDRTAYDRQSPANAVASTMRGLDTNLFASYRLVSDPGNPPGGLRWIDVVKGRHAEGAFTLATILMLLTGLVALAGDRVQLRTGRH